MKLNYIGYNYTHKPCFKISRPDGAASDILINVKSYAKFVIDDIHADVPANSVVIIKKGTPHWYEYRENGTDDWFHFELTEEENKRYDLPYNSVMQFDDTSVLGFLISKMHYEYYSNNLKKEEKISSYFDILCWEIKEKHLHSVDSETPYNYLLYNVRANIYNKPERRFSIKYFADYVGISVSHFQRMYKKIFNITPNKDMILSRIERAKYLLKNTNYTVSDIARELKYENEVQLYRQFKSITGMTALEYRKKYK